MTGGRRRPGPVQGNAFCAVELSRGGGGGGRFGIPRSPRRRA
ncbi:MAG: hypothetical protein ACK559_00805 [bacterium]